MFDKICFYISGIGCLYSVFMFIVFSYLTRVEFYTRTHGLLLITGAIFATICCGVAAIMFENLIKNKRK